jgi:very-short-patch-repair endonuclease
MPSDKRFRVHPEILPRALEFRHPLTPAEETLWQAIRNRQIGGFKIRRQEPLGPYIADFYCPEVRLVIEIDGPSHNQQIEYDAIRTAWLEGFSCTMIRFTNEQVSYRMGEVLDEINRVCKEKQRAET